MDYRERYAKLFAVVVGAVLIVAGVIGFFYESAFTSDVSTRDAVFGILDVNGWHNVVHIVTGLVATYVDPDSSDALERLRPLAADTLLAIFGVAMADASEKAFGREIERLQRRRRAKD